MKKKILLKLRTFLKKIELLSKLSKLNYGTMLVNNIMDIISKNIAKYNAEIAKKYDLDIAELDTVWDEVSGAKAKKGRATKSGDSSSNKKSEGPCCQYVFSKGKNAGSTCPTKPKDGAEFCSKHNKASSDTPKKEKKEKPEKVEKKTFIIRKNKELDMFWNPETTLVFKSKEKVVIGSCKDNKVIPLTDEDVKNCEKYSLKYERNEEDAEEEDAEEDAEEEEEEENEIEDE